MINTKVLEKAALEIYLERAFLIMVHDTDGNGPQNCAIFMQKLLQKPLGDVVDDAYDCVQYNDEAFGLVKVRRRYNQNCASLAAALF